MSLDLAKRSSEASIAPVGASEKDWKTFPTHFIAGPPESPEAIASLLAWVDAMKGPGAVCRRVVVEATANISKRFARALNVTKRLPLVNIVNPQRSKAYLIGIGVRDKSDKVDAACLALYGVRCDLEAPREPNAAEEQICELSRLREALVGDRTAWKNRLGEACGQVVRKRIEGTVADIDRAVKKVDDDIRQALKTDEALERQFKSLQKITSIGFVTAAAITGELGDLRDYTRGQIVSVAGIFPKIHESGESVHKRPHLARGGGSHLRRALYMCVTSLFHSKSPLRQYLTKYIDAGKPKMYALCAVMRKLLLVARAVVKAGGEYRPEMIGQPQIAKQGETAMT